MRAHLCKHERESVLSEPRECARADTRARASSAFPFARSPSGRADKRVRVCPYKHKGEGLLVQARGCRRPPEKTLSALSFASSPGGRAENRGPAVPLFELLFMPRTCSLPWSWTCQKRGGRCASTSVPRMSTRAFPREHEHVSALSSPSLQFPVSRVPTGMLPGGQWWLLEKKQREEAPGRGGTALRDVSRLLSGLHVHCLIPEHQSAESRKGVDVGHKSVPARAHRRGAACASTGVPRSSMRARLCEHERESVLSEP